MKIKRWMVITGVLSLLAGSIVLGSCQTSGEPLTCDPKTGCSGGCSDCTYTMDGDTYNCNQYLCIGNTYTCGSVNDWFNCVGHCSGTCMGNCFAQNCGGEDESAVPHSCNASKVTRDLGSSVDYTMISEVQIDPDSYTVEFDERMGKYTHSFDVRFGMQFNKPFEDISLELRVNYKDEEIDGCVLKGKTTEELADYCLQWSLLFNAEESQIDDLYIYIILVSGTEWV